LLKKKEEENVQPKFVPNNRRDTLQYRNRIRYKCVFNSV